MKIIYRWSAVIMIIALTTFTPVASRAAVSNWQKGATMIPRWNTDFGSDSFKKSIDNLAATGANYVTMVVPLRQSNIYSTDIGPRGDTPTDQSLIDGIKYIHGKGMQVNLKIHVDPDDGQWRAYINPGDRDGWFAAYGKILQKYATIASQQKVEEYTIGAELISMSADDANSTNTANWNKLIAQVRSSYSGKVTYSANWGVPGWNDEKNRVTFWSQLDSIGMAAYFPLNTSAGTTDAYKGEWDKINKGDIGPLQQKYNKPVLFTEVGYKSVDGAHDTPYAWWQGGNYNGNEQATLYDALFSYWNDQSSMQGVQLWDWSSDPNAGGQGNIDYTPQNKPAQEVMTKWFTSNQPPSPPTPPTPGALAASASVNPSSVNQGQNVNINAKVTNGNTAASGLIVDIEVYNSSNQKVFQKYFDNQNFAAGESKNYQTSWNAGAVGKYTVDIGVFSANWSSNILWQGDAATINVTSTPTPPPSGGSIDIWWPTNGVTLGGVQPFKALVKDMKVEDYVMYWQVDGNHLNEMYNSNTDYPHKEAMVDVSTWHWHGNGPYHINFVAKDKSGNTIAQKAIDIFVP